MASMNSQTIIFFDGVCHLCNSFVDFAIRADKKRKFKFAPLQGETAAKLLSEKDRKSLESVVVYFDGKTVYRSRAILKVFSGLGGIYSLAALFGILPTAVLDFFYHRIAINRYKWFGEREFCRLPLPEEREYLLP
jgi:predicted DCC family thiol-disulfide oxidoreductase YuxK